MATTTTMTTALRSRRARLLPPSLALLLLLALLFAAAAAADAARPAGRDLALAKKKKHDDDDGGGGGDKPPPGPPSPPAPGPDDDDTIAEMKACHAERGKGRSPCLAVPRCRFCARRGSLPSWLPLPALCVHELEARLMPEFLWQCAKEEEEEEEEAEGEEAHAAVDSAAVVPNADACEGLPRGSCAASGGVCVWCVAAAVPSSCFTVAQAARLPPGVFDCGVAPSAAAAAVL
jgi:hypothetical protein